MTAYFNHAKHTLAQLDGFLHDAINEEQISAEEIYDVIIENVASDVEHYQMQYLKSERLFNLLKGYEKPDTESEEESQEEPEDYNYNDMIAKGYYMTDDGFWMPPEKKDKVIKWSLPVEEAEDGEYYITFPEDLLEAAKLAPGDSVEWVDLTENTYLLRKVDE
jgi:hypothetical protein